MAGSTYSSNLKIELMTTGENSGTWGDITNTNLGTALEQAIVGYGNPDYVSDANLTISITNSNAAQAARALVLNVTSTFGSLTATRELVVPTIQKQYIVQNNTTGGQSITVKTSAGTGITVPNGRKAHLYVDGTNVIQMFDFVDINGGTIDGTPIGGSSAAAGAFTTLAASGATSLNGAVTLGDAAGDNITFNGTVTSHLLFTDNTYDIGASGATRPRNLYLAGAATIGGNLSVGGTLTLTGGLTLNGNVTVGDSAADTLTINSTITSNLIFTDNTYDIGASGATRPRNLFLAGNITAGGNQTLTGALTVDSTTDSSSTTTGSIQTDGGLGVAKALYVGTTANIAGAVTLSGGTANGVLYLNGSKVATTGSALTFDGSTFTAEGLVDVDGVSGSPLLRLRQTTAGAGTEFNTTITENTGVTFDCTDGGTVARSFIWSQVGSEQMRLTSTGLGIGTSSPAAKLEVNTTTGFTFAATPTAGVMVGARGTTGGSFLVRTNSYSASYDSGLAIDGTYPAGGGNLGDSNVNIKAFGVYSGGGFGSTLAFWTSANTTLSERMRITSAGYVGIATTSPNFLMHISTGSTASITQPTAGSYGLYIQQNSSGSTGGLYIQDGASNSGNSIFVGDNNGAVRFVVNQDGYVGIGASPATGKVLTISNAGADAAVRINAPTGYYSYLELTENSSLTAGNYWQIGKIPTTNDLQFWNGSERARFLSTGQFLVNTGSTQSTARLVVGGDLALQSIVGSPGDAFNSLLFYNNNSSGFTNASISATVGTTINSGNIIFNTNSAGSFAERARISQGGAVCIGTTTATNTRLNVVGGASLTYWEGSSSSTNITSGTPDQFVCKINNSTVGNFWQTRFLNNSGNTMFSMGAQTTSHTANFNNGKFFVDGGIRSTPETFIVDTTNEYSYFGYSGSNGAYRIQVNGQIFATSSTIATSDGRYKENVQDLTGALDLINALRPVSFNWKKHNVHVFNTEDTTVGFIAQEVQQVMADKPYLNSFVKLNKCTSFDEVEQKYCDEEFLGFAETNMVAILTKALQELSAKFDSYVASHP